MRGRIWTDALREIRKTLSRFFSLFLLSALAVAFLAGLRATAPDMERSADAYFDAQGLMDLRVLSALGLTGEDVQVLAAQPGIEAAEGSYTVDAIAQGGENDLIVKVHALSAQGFNTPVLEEGRMPQSAGECLVEPTLLTKMGLTLGDSMTLDTGTGDYADALDRNTFTIVGTAQSPLYISVERGSSSLGTGKVAAFVLLPMDAFSMETFTEIYLRTADTAGLICYSDDYEDRIDALTDALDPLAQQRGQLRYDQVIEDAQAQVDDAQAELDDAQAELDDARAEAESELADARAKLEDARIELDDGWTEYYDGLATFETESADAWRQIADGEAELEDARADLDQGEQDYASGVQELEDGWVEYRDGLADLVSGWQEYQDGLDQLSEAQVELDDGYWQLQDAEQEYSDALQALLDGEQEYADGLAQYRSGLLEIRENAPALMEGRQELEAARAKLAAGEAEMAQGQALLDQKRAEYEQGLPIFQASLTAAKALMAMDQLTDGEFIAAVNRALENPVLLNAAMYLIENTRTQLTAQREERSAQLEQLEQILALPDLTDGERAALERQRTGLAQQRDGLAAELEKLEGQLFAPDLSEQERAALQEARADLLQQQADLEDQLQQVEAALAQPDLPPEEQARLEEEREALANQLDALGIQLAETEGQLFRPDLSPEDRAVLEQQYTQCTQAHTDLDGQIQQLDFVLSNSNLSEEARGQLEEQQTQLEQGIATIDQTLAQLPADAQALTAQLTTLSETYAKMEAAPGELAAAQAELEAGIARLQAGWAEYLSGLAEFNDGVTAFEDGIAAAQEAAQQLTEARQELDEGWGSLLEGRLTLDENWAEYDRGRLELEDGLEEMADAFQEIEDARVQLRDARITLMEGEGELSDARTELDDGWQQYWDGLAELNDNKNRLPGELADAQAELDDALVSLQDGEVEYADGLADYQEGEAEAEQELSDAQAQLDDARVELADARAEIANVDSGEWYVLGRNANTGYVSFQQDAQRMGNLASVFPVIFFLVAALVCLTTMTRMVEEQRLQIGCLKALGYGFFASLLGGIVGLLLGCTGIPLIIFTAWKVLYTLGDLVLDPALATSTMALGAAVFCVTGTAFAACFAALSSTPAALMRPKAPPAGKRVLLERLGPVWRRLSFTYKVTVRNLFRYKKRFWMTVLGIGGCTALIVTGFGLRDSIFDMLDKQYGEIATYSANVALEDGVTQQQLADITQTLDGDELVAGWTSSYQISLTIESASRSVDGYLMATTDPENFSSFLTLRHREDGQPVSLPQEGVVLTEKLADLLGVGPGDRVVLAGETRVEATVADITENYVFHYVYLSPSAYEAIYGQAPQTNTLMVTYTQDTQDVSDTLSQRLMALPGITSVSRIQDSRATFTRSMESVDYAVILIIVCAAALAFVVLFNLTNINITERLRELATLKVLGFYDRELAAYVFRENVLLTIFGVLLGVIMGKYLHQWLVLTVEIDMVMFGRSAHPASYLYAVVLTLVFSTLVNLAARRRLRGIDMVESLKTVE